MHKETGFIAVNTFWKKIGHSSNSIFFKNIVSYEFLILIWKISETYIYHWYN